MTDGSIRVRVLSVNGGRVRLRIAAPGEVQVVRSEQTHGDGNSTQGTASASCGGNSGRKEVRQVRDCKWLRINPLGIGMSV